MEDDDFKWYHPIVGGIACFLILNISIAVLFATVYIWCFIFWLIDRIMK